ncbi:MAG: M20/M25/M40 family metallo-hydrolase, partial [Anaerolineaceae bacterium]|nr:M20/M25/M40 family metallo-hydrolase [Anaerolineaceae bacterium]
MAAFEFLTQLQQEVGTRRAGTKGDVLAQQWLKDQAASLGYRVELDEFTFIGSEVYRPLFNLFVVIWLAGCFILLNTTYSTIGWLGLLVFFLFTSFFQKNLDLKMAKTISQNVLAGLTRPLSDYVQDQTKGPAFLVCAHYDTPRTLPPWFNRFRGVYSFVFPLPILGLLLFVASTFLRLFSGFFLSFGAGLERLAEIFSLAALILTAPALLLMVAMSLVSLFRKRSDSPGADDNGSGVALVLEVARRFKENPLQNAEVFCAWWGAEEKGLFGSRQFVRRFDAQLDKDKLYLINADCVGVGKMLTVHTGQGVLRRKPTDPQTVLRIESIAQRLGIPTIRSWESFLSGGSSDHAGWVEHGYRHAVSLLRENASRLSLPARLAAFILRIPDANQLDLDHIHSAADTLEGIMACTRQEFGYDIFNLGESQTVRLDELIALLEKALGRKA